MSGCGCGCGVGGWVRWWTEVHNNYLDLDHNTCP